MSVASNLSEKGDFSRSFSDADSTQAHNNLAQNQTARSSYPNTGSGRMTTNALKENANSRAKKAAGAFKTISEVADDLGVQQHVLRFWETKFTQVRPLKRGGGRRYYRPEDVEILKKICDMLYNQGYTIKGVQKILKGFGKQQIASLSGNDLSAQSGNTVASPATELALDNNTQNSTQSPQAMTVAEEALVEIDEPENKLKESAVNNADMISKDELGKIEQQYKDNLRLFLSELYEIRKSISDAKDHS